MVEAPSEEARTMMGKNPGQPAKENAVPHNQGWLDEGCNQHAEDCDTPDKAIDPSPQEGEGRSLYTSESKLSLESWRFEQEVTTTILKWVTTALGKYWKHLSSQDTGSKERLLRAEESNTTRPADPAFVHSAYRVKERGLLFDELYKNGRLVMSDIPDIIPPGQNKCNRVCPQDGPHSYESAKGRSPAPVGPNFTNYDLTIFLKAKSSFSQGRKAQKMQHAST